MSGIDETTSGATGSSEVVFVIKRSARPWRRITKGFFRCRRRGYSQRSLRSDNKEPEKLSCPECQQKIDLYYYSVSRPSTASFFVEVGVFGSNPSSVRARIQECHDRGVRPRLDHFVISVYLLLLLVTTLIFMPFRMADAIRVVALLVTSLALFGTLAVVMPSQWLIAQYEVGRLLWCSELRENTRKISRPVQAVTRAEAACPTNRMLWRRSERTGPASRVDQHRCGCSARFLDTLGILKVKNFHSNKEVLDETEEPTCTEQTPIAEELIDRLMNAHLVSSRDAVLLLRAILEDKICPRLFIEGLRELNKKYFGLSAQ
jgi:hypothetical protein